MHNLVHGFNSEAFTLPCLRYLQPPELSVAASAERLRQWDFVPRCDFHEEFDGVPRRHRPDGTSASDCAPQLSALLAAEEHASLALRSAMRERKLSVMVTPSPS